MLVLAFFAAIMPVQLYVTKVWEATILSRWLGKIRNNRFIFRHLDSWAKFEEQATSLRCCKLH